MHTDSEGEIAIEYQDKLESIVGKVVDKVYKSSTEAFFIFDMDEQAGKCKIVSVSIDDTDCHNCGESNGGLDDCCTQLSYDEQVKLGLMSPERRDEFNRKHQEQAAVNYKRLLRKEAKQRLDGISPGWSTAYPELYKELTGELPAKQPAEQPKPPEQQGG